MEISLRLSDLSNEEMTFLKQIGVDYIDLHNPLLIPGYEELGAKYRRNVSKVLKKIRDADLDVACFRFTKIREALLGKPEGERQIDELCNLIKTLGSEYVPVIEVDFHGLRKSPGGVPGRYQKRHRGGYEMAAFSLELMRRELSKRDLTSPWAHHFIDKVSPEEYWSNLIHILEMIIPFLEDSEVKLAMHTDDPPVPDSEGLLPGITNHLQMLRLMDEAPSKNVGLLFCVGTRYESGVDIYELIRIFGVRNRIFHVHFRNVWGTIPSTGGYEEVMLDDGDMDMFKVLQALKNVGYDGAVNPDHMPKLIGDTPNRNAGRAFAVGYIKALLSALR